MTRSAWPRPPSSPRRRLELIVYPARRRRRRRLPLATAMRSPRPAPTPERLGRSGDEFYSLRPYVVGDDLRRVHWPSTARRDELIVRQDERHWQGRTTVLLDVRRAVHTPTSASSGPCRPPPASCSPPRCGGTRSAWSPPTAPTRATAPARRPSGPMLEYLAAVTLTDRGDEVRVDHPGTLVALTTPAGVSTTGRPPARADVSSSCSNVRRRPHPGGRLGHDPGGRGRLLRRGVERRRRPLALRAPA